MALREIDDLKKVVSKQLNTLKDAVDGDVEIKLASLTRDINSNKRKEEGLNNGFQKTLELMLDLEHKLTQKQTSFQNEIKASIQKITSKVESIARGSADIDVRMSDLEFEVQGEMFTKV